MVPEPPLGRAQLFIGGERSPPTSGVYAALRDPSTGAPLGEVAQGTTVDVDRALEAAERAAESWAETPAYRRARLLRDVAQRVLEDREGLAHLIAREVGKPIRDARAEAERAAEVFRLAAEQCRLLTGESFPADAYERPAGNEHRMLFTVRDPIGVVVAISPFNFPLNLLAHKVAPALAAGNPVVAKPTSAAPFTALRLIDHLVAAGLPSGVLNVVLGAGGAVGDRLVDHPATRLVTFTGSTAVGQRIAERAGRGLKRVILELGGLDPFIVLEDAPWPATLADATRGAFGYSGQVCTASKRFIVTEAVADRFARELASAADRLRVGPALEETTEVGPVIDAAALDRLDALVTDASAHHANVLAGGGRAAGMPGHFFRPTVLDHVVSDARVAQEEPFGPVAPILRVRDEDEAIRVANATPYGLQASVYTTDIRKAFRVAKRIRTGGVHINDPTTLRWDALPFGGVKSSGLGREGLRYAMEEMTDLKLISINFGAANP
ncbi:MAG TPA: aldehyde dehydrogenase family protein [Thermoplasmata archaeon]|nr:aldehyde dehydrogenase family protein [Thermoplasmata archaeon]